MRNFHLPVAARKLNATRLRKFCWQLKLFWMFFVGGAQKSVHFCLKWTIKHCARFLPWMTSHIFFSIKDATIATGFSNVKLIKQT